MQTSALFWGSWILLLLLEMQVQKRFSLALYHSHQHVSFTCSNPAMVLAQFKAKNDMPMKGGPSITKWRVWGERCFVQGASMSSILYPTTFFSCTGMIITIAAQPFKINEQKTVIKKVSRSISQSDPPNTHIWNCRDFLLQQKTEEHGRIQTRAFKNIYG